MRDSVHSLLPTNCAKHWQISQNHVPLGMSRQLAAGNSSSLDCLDLLPGGAETDEGLADVCKGKKSIRSRGENQF
jgi:hypothetical protein